MSDLASRLGYQIAVNAIVLKGTRRGVSPIFTPDELDEMEDAYWAGTTPAEFAAEIEDRDNSIVEAS